MGDLCNGCGNIYFDCACVMPPISKKKVLIIDPEKYYDLESENKKLKLKNNNISDNFDLVLKSNGELKSENKRLKEVLLKLKDADKRIEKSLEAIRLPEDSFGGRITQNTIRPILKLFRDELEVIDQAIGGK